MFGTYNESDRQSANYYNVYGNFRSRNAIDLRKEFSEEINTSGYYIGWRCFDLTTHSIYWDDTAKEAINGPAWEYTDYVFKTRRIIPGRTSSDKEVLQRFGIIDDNSYIYYVSHIIDIKKEDILFRIDNETSSSPPSLVKPLTIYDITMIEPKIDGELIYNVVQATITPSINDITLRGKIPVTYIPV